MAKKVMVSGGFDLLHSGHINFLQTAATYGDLYVALGDDDNIRYLKDREPFNSENDRLNIIKAIRYVKDAFISPGQGELHFADDLKRVQPDLFIVNEDGDRPAKRELMRQTGIEYLVLKRAPISEEEKIDPKNFTKIPYRIDLAGGWLDQPFVSKHHPGSVITFPIFGLPHETKKRPLRLADTIEFNTRSGMATSTRKTAIDLWGHEIDPRHHPHKLAKILFAHDNPPGKTEISGAQDSIGIMVPGITRSDYHGDYWPRHIESIKDELVADWLEDHLSLVPLNPRGENFQVLKETRITPERARALSEATEKVWQALHEFNLLVLGEGVRESFEAQIAMFPAMVDPEILDFIKETQTKHQDNLLGYKLSGAGGGGYLTCITREPLPDSIGVKIVRQILSD